MLLVAMLTAAPFIRVVPDSPHTESQEGAWPYANACNLMALASHALQHQRCISRPLAPAGWHHLVYCNDHL